MASPDPELSSAKRIVLALTVATVFFGRQIASWSSPGNRYLYHWQRSDAFYLIAAVVIVSLALVAMAEVLRRLGGRRATLALRLAFLLVVGQLAVSFVLLPNAEQPLASAGVASLAVAGMGLIGFMRAEPLVTRVAVRTCLVFAPLPLILFVQMLSWRSWRECGAGSVGPAPEPSARSVFILVFDEWSMERSWAGNQFLPQLARLRGLAERSFVYSNAHAPASETYKSIPRMLYQESGLVLVNDGTADWRVGGRTVRAEMRPNLFRSAGSRDYRTALVGWYLPYAGLVGDDLDFCRAYPQVVKRRGAARLWDLLWANLQFLPDPASQALWRAQFAGAFSDNWFALEGLIEAEALQVARTSPPNTLAFFHFPVPHAPFIFNPDGSYRGAFPGHRMEGTVADQHRHFQYLDTVLGRFLDTLRSSGKLDSALVVVTSDHSWKLDPNPEARALERVRWVPLLIKWPGQDSPVSVSGEFCLMSIGRIIDAAIGDRAPVERARTLLDSLANASEGDKCRDF
ncbi:MAG: sulfatase-like hydrolase/transferase [Gemmatimonadales bacterium]|nr:sulfatase-like hydrolase/transferase [Gemmatimonadales bacterium]